MKRIFVYYFVLLSLGFSKSALSQIDQTVFWYETFGLGCNQGALASGAAPTATNGSWNVTTMGGFPGNGTQANEWFISATEAGRPVGVCGDGCLNNAGFTDRSLHISSNIAPPFLDPGAVYLQNSNSNTDKRVESPFINCTGKNNVVLSLKYLANGVPGSDYAEVLYSPSAGVWVPLGVLAPSMGACAPQGLWAPASFTLPPAANGNPNVKVGFRWRNADAAGPGNVSVAVDDIVISSPVVQFTMQPVACVNLTFSPTITNSVNPTDSYSWSCNPPDATFNPVSPSPVMPAITCSTTGIHTITCYAMDGAAITSSITQTVSIVNNITYTAVASPSMICVGDIVALSASGSATAYVWSPGNIPGSPVFVSPNVSTIYTVTGNDASGCPGIGTVLVTIGQSPIINVVTTANAVCAGYTSTMTANGASTYTWTGTTLLNPVYSNSVVGGPGSYTVCANGVASMPCISCSVIVIAEAAPLAITASALSGTTCIYKNFPQDSKPVQLSATGAGVYTWMPTASLNYSAGPTVIAKPIISTCYTVTGSTSVCKGQAVICVTVIPQFTMDVLPKQPIICVGDSITLRIANIGTLGIAPFGYSWIEPLNAPPPSMSNPLSQSVVISPTNLSSPVTYSAEVYDARGCASIPRVSTTTVIPQPQTTILIPNPNAIPTNTICYLGTTSGSNPQGVITLTAQNQNGLPPEYAPTYTWTSPYYAPYNPFLNGAPANGNTVTLAAPIRTPQVVTYTVQSGFNGIKGCTRFDTVSVRVVDCRSLTAASFYVANIDAKKDTICARTCVTFVNQTDTMAGGPLSYTWICTGGSPPSSNLKDPTICYNLPGTFNVILLVKSPYNQPEGSNSFKSEYKYIKVVDVPNPRIVFTPLINTNPLYQPIDALGRKDTVIRFGTSVAVTASNAARYEWTPNFYVSPVTTAPSVTLSPIRTQWYVLHGYNSANCRYVDSLLVTVIEDCGEMFIPNAFSPNNDGVNDILKVRGLCLESMTFMVFNQWGEKVFETADQEVGWDGTYKGELLNTGVFVYRLEGKTHQGKPFSLKGNVTLIR
jgi:gliding motility-associated-like protein